MDQLLNDYFNACDISYVEFNLNDISFSYANDVFLNKIGYNLIELKTLTLKELLISEDIEDTLSAIKSINLLYAKSRFINTYKHKNNIDYISFMWFSGSIGDTITYHGGISKAFATDVTLLVNDIKQKKTNNNIIDDFLDYLAIK